MDDLINFVPDPFDVYSETIERFKAVIDEMRTQDALIKEDLRRVKTLTYSWVIAQETIDCKHTYGEINKIVSKYL